MDADKKRLWVGGQFVKVTDEVYDAYMKGDRKIRYFESDLKAERFLMDIYAKIKYNKPEELVGVVNAAFSQPFAV